VIYERVLGERRAFPGEVVNLTLRVTNQKLLPLSWLTIEDQWSRALPLTEEKLVPTPSGRSGYFRAALALRWFDRVSRHLQVRCTRRGYYPLGPVRLSSGDIWGLFRRQITLEHRDWLVVYPQVLPLEALGFPTKEPLGERAADWRIFEDPNRVAGIREHRPEDGFRHIHWKASARRQELQVKSYEPTTSHNLLVFLNVATFTRHWEGTNPLLLERSIAVAASIAHHAANDRFIVGLVANGTIPHSDQSIKVLPSRRPDQLARVLEALAAATSFTTSTIESLLLAESPRLPWGATIVLVTCVVSDEMPGVLTHLHRVGRRIVLVSLEDKPARSYDLPSGILVYHLPAGGLPFDETLLGDPGEWAPDVPPPVHFARSAR
jgi:uncharacterized protein (DUF58 family)